MRHIECPEIIPLLESRREDVARDMCPCTAEEMGDRSQILADLVDDLLETDEVGDIAMVVADNPPNPLR